MPDELDREIDSVVASALEAMQDPHWTDSPVRSSLDLYTAPRAEWEDLRAQLRQLRDLHADELVAAAVEAPPHGALAGRRGVRLGAATRIAKRLSARF